MDCVWITGASGFIGRHLMEHICSLGGNDRLAIGVVGHGCNGNRFGWRHSVSTIDGSITCENLSRLQDLTGRPSTVIHLAGGASVGQSLKEPKIDFQKTVVASLELLEWARLQSCETDIVFVSSAAVYGAGYSRPISESDACTPFSPYGHHKAAAEGLFKSYASAYKIKSVIVRPFSVYGPLLRKQLIFDICRRLATSPAALTLHGTGEEMRDWLYVEDLAQILWMSCRLTALDVPVINACSGEAKTVREVAEQICMAWDIDCPIFFNGIVRNGDPASLIGNASKLHDLGFATSKTWNAGIASMVEWFKLNYVTARGS